MEVLLILWHRATAKLNLQFNFLSGEDDKVNNQVSRRGHEARTTYIRMNSLEKQLGNNNALNNARATLAAVQEMKQFRDVALERRRFPMEELRKFIFHL
ncbi:hypothetical protein YC2023_028133 [Brassica napus]